MNFDHSHHRLLIFCADTQVKLRETVQPLLNKARGTHCEQCLSKKQLQVKLVFEIEELARQFEAEYPADEFDKVSDDQTDMDTANFVTSLRGS